MRAGMTLMRRRSIDWWIEVGIRHRLGFNHCSPFRTLGHMNAEPPASSPSTIDAHRATIDDVARLAGVSKATVSRFLNNRDKLLTREISARVETAIAELGYVPSPMAQALKRGRSKLIGLVVADVANPFSVAVLRGAERACQEAGYLVVLFNLGNDQMRERSAVEALAAYRVEGFILNTLGGDLIGRTGLATHGKPVVLVDRRHPEMSSDFVSIDNFDAVSQAITHLRANGWRDFLHITEPIAGVSTRVERASAFRDYAVPQRGRATRAEVLEVATEHDPALFEALRALHHRSARRKLAIVSANAVTTLRVVAAVRELGLEFGKDLGFVGFDETEWAPLIGPGLTTIAQPTDDIGRVAATCLLERIGGRHQPPRQILLPGNLVARGSSRRPA